MERLDVVFAVLGGALMGLGLGMLLANRSVRQAHRRLRRAEARLRTTVIPLLERQAERLGIPRQRRSYGVTDSLQVASDLAAAILQHDDPNSLPWSDTLQGDIPHLHKSP